MTKFENPFNLPDEHMCLLGHIVACWESMDIVLSEAVAFITMHNPQQSNVLIFNLSFGSKINLIEAFARPLREENSQLWKEFERVLKDIRKVNNLRNDYVHNKWIMEDGNQNPTRYIFLLKNGKLTEKTETVTTEMLINVCNEILSVGDSFSILMKKFGMETKNQSK